MEDTGTAKTAAGIIATRMAGIAAGTGTGTGSGSGNGQGTAAESAAVLVAAVGGMRWISQGARRSSPSPLSKTETVAEAGSRPRMNHLLVRWLRVLIRVPLLLLRSFHRRQHRPAMGLQPAARMLSRW
jgi:hypothetical protein